MLSEKEERIMRIDNQIDISKLHIQLWTLRITTGNIQSRKLSHYGSVEFSPEEKISYGLDIISNFITRIEELHETKINLLKGE